jgi:hypothetical protein
MWRKSLLTSAEPFQIQRYVDNNEAIIFKMEVLKLRSPTGRLGPLNELFNQPNQDKPLRRGLEFHSFTV